MCNMQQPSGIVTRGLPYVLTTKVLYCVQLAVRLRGYTNAKTACIGIEQNLPVSGGLVPQLACYSSCDMQEMCSLYVPSLLKVFVNV